MSHPLGNHPDIYIIGFDSGEITGVSIFAWEQPMIQRELPWREAVTLIHTYAQALPNVLIAGERWDQNSSRSRPMTAQLAALRCSGAVEYVATLCKATFEQHSRADTKRVTDRMLKKLGWYERTKDGHANDSARVVGQSLLIHHPVEYSLLLERAGL